MAYGRELNCVKRGNLLSSELEAAQLIGTASLSEFRDSNQIDSRRFP